MGISNELNFTDTSTTTHDPSLPSSNHTPSPSNKPNKIEVDFYMPCKFDKYSSSKDMLVYTLIYNISLQPNMFLQSMTSPLNKDTNLLALKLSLDNSILETKAK